MGKGPSQEYHKQLRPEYEVGSLTCLSVETIRERANADFPLVLNIEPTNHCQLRCPCCPTHSKSKRKKGFMDVNLFDKIINECREHPRLVTLNMVKDGESTLHDLFDEMIEMARCPGIAETIQLTTNALDIPDRLLYSGVTDITISLDAFYEQTYEEAKGRPLYKQAFYNTLGLFAARSPEVTPRIRVKIMETGSNSYEVHEFREFWKHIADEVQVTGVHNWSGGVDSVVTDLHPAERYPCALPWYMMAINWDGTVSACNLDWNAELIVGDLNKQTIAEVWQGESMKVLRRRELNGLPTEFCRACVVWGGCRDMTVWMKERKEFL